METLAAREAGLADPHPPEALAVHSDGPTVPPIRGGVLVAEQTAERHRVGQLLRQPTVRRPAEEPARLDEFIGAGFCIVGKSRDALELNATSREILAELGGTTLSMAEFERVEGHWDGLFEGYDAAIVRPDRIVFGVADADHPLDALVSRLASELYLHAN